MTLFFNRKLTTYTLRRTIRNYATSIRTAEMKVESLEKTLSELGHKTTLSDSLSSAEKEEEKTKDITTEKFIDERLYRQVLFTDLFSSVQGRAPLSTISS